MFFTKKNYNEKNMTDEFENFFKNTARCIAYKENYNFGSRNRLIQNNCFSVKSTNFENSFSYNSLTLQLTISYNLYFHSTC